MDCMEEAYMDVGMNGMTFPKAILKVAKPFW
jgi:hypothetical protein